jgi:hypothetical protein
VHLSQFATIHVPRLPTPCPVPVTRAESDEIEQGLAHEKPTLLPRASESWRSNSYAEIEIVFGVMLNHFEGKIQTVEDARLNLVGIALSHNFEMTFALHYSKI